MKKFIAFLFLILFLNILVVNNVKAVSCDDREYQCIECDYEASEGDFRYVVYSDGAGNAIIDEDESVKYKTNLFTLLDRVTGADFLNEEGTSLTCPFIRAVPDTTNKMDSQDQVPYILMGTLTRPRVKERNERLFEPTTDGPTEKPFISEEASGNKAIKTCLFVDKSETVRGESLKIRAKFDGTNFTFTVPQGYKAEIPKGQSQDKLKEEFNKDCDDMKIYFMVVDADSGEGKVVYVSSTKYSEYYEVVSMNNISDIDKINGKTGNVEREVFTPSDLCQDGGCDVDISGLCDKTPVISVLRFLGILLFVAKVLVPVLIIGMGIYHLFSIITSGKDDEVKKQVNNIVKRVIAGVIIFLLPSLVYWIFDVAGATDGGYSNCVNCILDLGKCETK